LKRTGKNIPRRIERFGGALLLILSVALPGIYFVTRWEMLSEHLRTEAGIYAHQVSSLINRNPNMWKYETIRLAGLLAKHPEDRRLKSVRVLDLEGALVMRRDNKSWALRIAEIG
jgi:hypothetical protein